MAQQNVGDTLHFSVQYDDATGPQGLAAAHAVLAVCESDLAKLKVYMPVGTGGAGDPFVKPRVLINIVNIPSGPGFGGGDNNGHKLGQQSLIRINPFSGPGVQISNDYAGFVFVAEMAELLMGFYGWDAGSSQGEALSRVMAEDLHPASAAVFVNTWLSFPTPRPDWISRNETSSPLVRADLDAIAYGNAILFLYFLRYQLDFSYSQICGAGGLLLSDRYRHLTGAADDPAVRMESLLNRHFGNGNIQLGNNNPFPLLDTAQRRIYLSFGPETAISRELPLQAGIAHIRPFFTCPAGNYPYREYGLTTTRTITATAYGIGYPSFAWKINGKLVSGSGSSSVIVPADIPDPQNPGNPSHRTTVLAFDYQVDQSQAPVTYTSSLTLTTHSFDGDYQVALQVGANESAVNDAAVTADQTLVLHTRVVAYGGSYEADRQRCVKHFEDEVSRYIRVIEDPLVILHNLPDPPEPGYLPAALEAALKIHEELARVAETDHGLATKLAAYVAQQTRIPSRVFLKDGRTPPVKVDRAAAPPHAGSG